MDQAGMASSHGEGLPEEEALLREDAYLRLGPARLIRDGKVMRGKNGWLFLANDSHNVLAQQAGELKLSESQLERWRQVLEGRTAQLAELGAPYVFLIAPDTHSVYPEKLPDGYTHSPDRPVTQLLGHLADAGSTVEVIYPIDELMAAKPERAVCSRFDHHWSEFGAFVAYGRVLDGLEGRIPIRRLSREDVVFDSAPAPGDLAYKVGAEEQATNEFARYWRRARLLEDNCIEGLGTVVTVECPRAPEGACVLVGDSYAHNLLKLLAESFRRLTYMQTPALDYELIARERPDVVVSVMSERFLIDVPDDEHDPSIAELVSNKQQQGRTRSLLRWWDRVEPGPLDLPLPPIEVERLRAHLLAEGRRRAAVLVSLLAYAGLHPREALELGWPDVRADALVVKSPEDGATRFVPLYEPVADDLREWRRASGDSGDGLLFGELQAQWEHWREQVYQPAAAASGVRHHVPGHLRLTLCAMLARSGATVADLARRIEAAPTLIVTVSEQAVELLDELGPMSVEAQILEARTS